MYTLAIQYVHAIRFDKTPPPQLRAAFLKALHHFGTVWQGSAAVVSTYKAYGTSVDYAIRNAVVPEAYT